MLFLSCEPRKVLRTEIFARALESNMVVSRRAKMLLPSLSFDIKTQVLGLRYRIAKSLWTREIRGSLVSG